MIGWMLGYCTDTWRARPPHPLPPTLPACACRQRSAPVPLTRGGAPASPVAAFRRDKDDAMRTLLDESLLFTGLFALLHSSNQDLLHYGTSPTILQRLSNLPFGYFSDPRMARPPESPLSALRWR